MKQPTLNIPGMRVPRPIVFIHGFASGRCKVAGLDPETECICSGYITEKINLYDSLSHNRMKMLEDETKGVRSEAFDIMAEEAQIRQLQNEAQAEADKANTEAQKPEPEPKTIQEIREAQKRNAARQANRNMINTNQDQLQSRHRENLKRLGEIDEKIRSCELRAQEELEATATKLQSIFATYTKGALLKPVLPKYIPVINRYDFELYKQSHAVEDQQMRNILKEVYSYE